MKIAMPLHENRISPRFGNAREFLLVTTKDDRDTGRQTLTLDLETPVQIAECLAREGVDLVLSGGMNSEYQREFRLRNIAVIWGLIGEAEDVLDTYLNGQVFAGMGPCPPVRNPRRSPRGAKRTDERLAAKKDSRRKPVS